MTTIMQLPYYWYKEAESYSITLQTTLKIPHSRLYGRSQKVYFVGRCVLFRDAFVFLRSSYWK